MSVPALVVKDLTKVYNNGFKALKGINLSVQQGDFFALLGPNGAGKSTTLGILSGLVQKTSGTAEVMGFDVNTEAFSARRYLGVVPQEFNFNQFEKVYDILITQVGYFGLTHSQVKDEAEKLLKIVKIVRRTNIKSRNMISSMYALYIIGTLLIKKIILIIHNQLKVHLDIDNFR